MAGKGKIAMFRKMTKLTGPRSTRSPPIKKGVSPFQKTHRLKDIENLPQQNNTTIKN